MSDIDLWFGDSWVIGSELWNTTPKRETPKKIFPWRGLGDNPYHAFSTLTSFARQRTFYNFAKTGGSSHFALYNLISFLKNNYKDSNKYTAFLCLTGETRNFSINLNDEMLHYNINFTDEHRDEGILNEYKFDPGLSVYENTLTLNYFNTLCQQHDIELIIVPLWTTNFIYDRVNTIPENNWLLTENTLVELSFGKKFTDILCRLDNRKILYLDDKIYNKYFTPSIDHPNTEGHKMLANTLLEKLDARTKI